jgi:hypothetical protein
MRRSRFFLIVSLLAALGASAATAAAPRGLQPVDWRTWWGKTSIRNGTYSLQSAAPSSPAETHSALMTTPGGRGDQAISVTATTLAQLRTGSAPNPWEVAWVLFRFRDLTSYYWFILKPNGWELGKKQGSDAQIFLASGARPQLALGQRVQVQIRAEGPRIRVSVDGRPVTDYVDAAPLPAGGSLGLYEEDSRVRFDAVSVTDL